jgi:hypothetical protein
VRAVQVKLFDKNNHTTKTTFLHSIIEQNLKRLNKPYLDWLVNYKKNDKIVTCLFGTHLLKQFPNNPIELVEAPKTAIYASLHFGLPENDSDLLWLSVFNLSSLSLDKCNVLENRKVILYPDLSKDGSAYYLWKRKSKELSHKIPNTQFMISNFLEENTTNQDKKNGLDLADYLIRKRKLYTHLNRSI